jgi:UDP-glucose 4-epimerase
MKCLVTGGSGFIGSHLVERLLEDSHDVVVLDRRKPVQPVEWIQKDVRNPLDSSLTGFDLVFHLAAVANARKCGEDPSLAYHTNVIGTLNILQSALKAGVDRVVVVSSVWVAGTQQGDVVNEKSPFELENVNTIYGAAKLGQEMLCYSFLAEHGGPNYTVLRYGIPYGERMWRGLVVRAFMDMAERTGIISIMGDGKQSRPFLYVGDLCRAHLAVLKPVATNKTYNLGGARSISVEELAREVIKHFPAKLEFIPQARVEPKLKHISSWLAETELGWVPEVPIEVGIQHCVDWWKTLDRAQKDEEYWC